MHDSYGYPVSGSVLQLEDTLLDAGHARSPAKAHRNLLCFARAFFLCIKPPESRSQHKGRPLPKEHGEHANLVSTYPRLSNEWLWKKTRLFFECAFVLYRALTALSRQLSSRQRRRQNSISRSANPAQRCPATYRSIGVDDGRAHSLLRHS